MRDILYRRFRPVCADCADAKTFYCWAAEVQPTKSLTQGGAQAKDAMATVFIRETPVYSIVAK